MRVAEYNTLNQFGPSYHALPPSSDSVRLISDWKANQPQRICYEQQFRPSLTAMQNSILAMPSPLRRYQRSPSCKPNTAASPHHYAVEKEVSRNDAKAQRRVLFVAPLRRCVRLSLLLILGCSRISCRKEAFT